MNNSVVCLGEVLIDFICEDIDASLEEGQHFLKKAGGAPANVTTCVSKLGGRSVFIGKVGDDAFGRFLIRTLSREGVDVQQLIKDKTSKTTLAFVSLKKDGQRDFIFNRGADEKLSYAELTHEPLSSPSIIHLGSATALLGGNLRETYFKVMESYHEKNFISFDPNFRTDLWKNNETEFIARSKEALKYADLVKVSDDELQLISGYEALDQAVDEVHRYGKFVLAITLGSKGTLISNGKEKHIIPSYPIKSLDSTGAGDAFIGGTLYKLSALEAPKAEVYNMDTLEGIVRFGNKVGAITCTKMGAIDALPTLTEVENFFDKD